MTASVDVPFPGAVRSGPDGAMYVTSFADDLPGLLRTGKIYRFDPEAKHPTARVFARDLGLPNGLTFDDRGYGYVGDTWLGVVRLRPNGTIDHAWSAQAPKNLQPSATVNGTSINGVAVDGDSLLVTMTTSLSGRVLRVPIDRPSATTVAADLTAPLPGFIDDLAVLGDGQFAATCTLGQLYVVDTAAGTKCAVQAGQPLTSIAVNPRDTREFAAGTETGDVLRLRIAR